MFTILIRYQLGTLSSKTIQNSKNDGHCLYITTQSDKATIDPPMPMIDNMKNDPIKTNDVDKDKAKKLGTNDEVSQKPIVLEKRADNDKEKGKEVTPSLKTIP